MADRIPESLRHAPVCVTSLLGMPAASAVSDRVTLDVRGEQSLIAGIELSRFSSFAPRPSPQGLSETKVLRASNFRYNSVLGDRTPLHLRPWAGMNRGAKVRGMVLTALKNIEKLPDSVSGNYVEKVSSASTIWRQKSCNNSRAMTSRTSMGVACDDLAVVTEILDKYQLCQGASRKLKAIIEDRHSRFSSQLYPYTIYSIWAEITTLNSYWISPIHFMVLEVLTSCANYYITKTMLRDNRKS